MLKKVNDNAYELELSANFGVSSTFNIADLRPYLGEEDEDINGDASEPPTPVPIASPLTRARAHQLNHQVSSFLCSCPSCLDP